MSEIIEESWGEHGNEDRIKEEAIKFVEWYIKENWDVPKEAVYMNNKGDFAETTEDLFKLYKEGK